MGDSLTIVVVILLAAILMFMFPLSSMSERNDDVAQLSVDTAVTEFVNKTRNVGKITYADYDKLISELYATGNTYNVELELRVRDENPSVKKNGLSEASTYKVGEDIYYSIYTSQIMDELEKNQVKYMKKGDILIVNVSNTNNTISQMFKSFLYGLSGNNTYSIVASQSGLVTVTGSAN